MGSIEEQAVPIIRSCTRGPVMLAFDCLFGRQHMDMVVCMDSVASSSDLDSGGKRRSGVTCKGCRLPFLTPAATALPRWSPLPTWALCSSRHHCIPDSRFDFVSFVTAFFYRRSYALTDNNLKKDYNA